MKNNKIIKIILWIFSIGTILDGFIIITRNIFIFFMFVAIGILINPMLWTFISNKNSKIHEKNFFKQENAYNQNISPNIQINSNNNIILDTYSKVAGVTFKNDKEEDIQTILPKLVNGAELTFVREPNNIYDKNAIKIYVYKLVHIGHVKKELAETIAPLMDSGCLVHGYVSQITGGDNENSYGCNYKITVLKEANIIQNNIVKKSKMVYITKEGKKYHYNKECLNGRIYYSVTENQAVSYGLTKCNKCCK